MKNFIIPIIVCANLLFFACSKKQGNSPQPTNTVTINAASYSTVVIGSQTWTSVNYNGPGGENYNNGSNSVIYGKLYTETEAKAIPLPAGWRIPTQNDYTNFFPAIGATLGANGVYQFPTNDIFKLMSKTGWLTQEGTDSLGFNAEPAGYLYNNTFSSLGAEARFLTSTFNLPNGHGNLVTFSVASYSLYFPALPYATDRASLRFVKDN